MPSASTHVYALNQVWILALAWPQFIQGFAVACFFMPLTTITLYSSTGTTGGGIELLSNFTRTLAGSIGTS